MISEQLYHVGKYQSCPIFEVKQRWARVSTWMGVCDRLENIVRYSNKRAFFTVQKRFLKFK